AANAAQTTGYGQAYANFATLVAPAITLQETDDADAELADSDDDAAANLSDIDDNNQAVKGKRRQPAFWLSRGQK
ncbi:MAG TPA: hypothetical protein VFW87_22930, partial [Pirellulales bacterium]|nr:hypothetical protein [Pirellulales bacterium]